MLGFRFCARAFSSWWEQGPLFIAVRGPITVAASLVAEHRLQTRRLSSCGSRASLLHGMWDPPRPGLEPVSPALAGRFSTTAPPGKPHFFFFLNENMCMVHWGKLKGTWGHLYGARRHVFLFLFLCVFFNFFQQCLTVFIVQVFHFLG